jgi:hypothetical protein
MNITIESLTEIMNIVNALLLCCSTSNRLEDGTMRGVTLVVVVIDVDILGVIVVVITNACVFTLGIIVVACISIN